MSDIFTLQTIPFNPELGMAFKNFRIENKITAKSLTIKFNKASSYISKLEKGDIKKIDSSFFIDLCNYISSSENGLVDFLKKTTATYTSYSEETRLIISNIDDLIVEHPLPTALISEIKKYMQSYNISNKGLKEKINENSSIADFPGYDAAPINEWYAYNNDYDNVFIKLSIPESYIDQLLNEKILTIHSVIAEAILYSMYSFNMDSLDARDLAHSKLTLYNILRIRGGNIVQLKDSTFDELFGGVEPEVADTLKSITSGLKLISTLTKKNGYGSKRIKQLNSNMKEDLGFSFAYMSLDITELEKKSKEKKQSFLNDLKDLIAKYSSDTDGLDIYD